LTVGLLAGFIWLAGCASPGGQGAANPLGITVEATSLPPTAPPTQTLVPTTDVTPVLPATARPLTPPEQPVYGYTNQRADGNRWVAGMGHLPDVEPLNIPLGQSPVWVVGVPANTGALWAVVLLDGSVRAFQVREDGSVEEISIQPNRWLVSGPPLLRWSANGLELVSAPVDDASPLTHPVPIPGGGLAYIATDGSLVVTDGEKETRLAVNALPDARLLVDPAGRILLLTDPTTRYAHGIAGDEFEAAQVTLVETRPGPRVVLNIVIPDNRVVEGIAPIWADLNGDGTREIIVTLSDVENGAQVVAFDEQGNMVANGPAIGQGFRWRHQLAVAAFAPDGALSLAEVLTPHIGGLIGFYRWVGDELVIDATLQGYTSHVINSRNLDMAAAGDFDGDRRPELLLPNQSLEALGGIRWEADGARVVWSLSLDGQLTTNIGAVTLPDGQIAVAVGMDTGVLRIWGQ